MTKPNSDIQAETKPTNPSTQPTTDQESTHHNLDIINQAEKKPASPSKLKPMNTPSSSAPILKTILAAFLIVAAGSITGFGLAQAVDQSSSTGSGGELKSAADLESGNIAVGDIYGSKDEKTFRDSAEGVLVAGGVEGEGSHHLLRPGGVSQNVYLTSSIMDLDLFVDHKVKVWGETFAGQKAGWLMDVGRLEVTQLNADKPATDSQ